ncbi:hypothetical protein RJT34_28042 [Clitoria ternatea]|uniref:Uncharacterized protein n=1 Tax=Clitoria ternatea TaxID=43366 RepID=A0AAN9F8T9_CLITE
MLKEGAISAASTGGSPNNWSRVCDMCRSAACCHADSAYLCAGCDARIHVANRMASRHERVWMCEACERAPATFLCKADAASLCSSCDADIHSANPLASRHHRVPILPISGSIFSEQEVQHHGFLNGCEEAEQEVVDEGEDEAEAASWLLPNPLRNNNEVEEENNCDFLLGEEYLDLVDCNSCGQNQFGNAQFDDHHHQKNYNTVSHHQNYAVVPVQCGGDTIGHVQQQSQHFQPGLDFDSSKACFSYDGYLSQSVSVSSMDVSAVPESTISDISMSHSKSPSELFPPLPMDREAKVLRYREKKKTRKFEKKIRYASRKAYAETRPRIKGRFAKRTDVDAEISSLTNQFTALDRPEFVTYFFLLTDLPIPLHFIRWDGSSTCLSPPHRGRCTFHGCKPVPPEKKPPLLLLHSQEVHVSWLKIILHYKSKITNEGPAQYGFRDWNLQALIDSQVCFDHNKP